MKALLNRFLGGAVSGLGMAAALFLVAQAYALSVPIFTGVQGTNPTVGTVPGVIPDLNTLINNLNAAVQKWLTVVDQAGNLFYAPLF